jgi:hypothetical protein
MKAQSYQKRNKKNGLHSFPVAAPPADVVKRVVVQSKALGFQSIGK